MSGALQEGWLAPGHLKYETSSPKLCGCGLCEPGADRSRAGLHPCGLPPVGDYPSSWRPPHQAPPYLLLDTCVVQNLRWARERAPWVGDDDEWQVVSERFGPGLGEELRAVAGLRLGLEGMGPHGSTPCPFIVTLSSWQELLHSPADRREGLEKEWRHWRARTQVLHPETFESVPHPLFTQMQRICAGRAPGSPPCRAWRRGAKSGRTSARFGTRGIGS